METVLALRGGGELRASYNDYEKKLLQAIIIPYNGIWIM